MATGTIRRGDQSYENLFFSSMAAVCLISVFIGFARTYYLAGLFRAHLPNLLLHIHGAVFSAWIVLLIAQTSLVAAHRVDLHRRLGILGFGLACLMVVLDVLVVGDRIARNTANPGAKTIEEVRAFYPIAMADVLMFATFVSLGYRNRFRPAVHKRLMLFATFSIMDAAFDRWPIFDPYSVRVVWIVCFVPLVLIMMGYDWWSTGRVQRVTLWSSVFLLAVQHTRLLIAYTAALQRFAAWAGAHSPSFR